MIIAVYSLCNDFVSSFLSIAGLNGKLGNNGNLKNIIFAMTFIILGISL